MPYEVSPLLGEGSRQKQLFSQFLSATRTRDRLNILLDEIDSVLYDIEHKLPDLGVLSIKETG